MRNSFIATLAAATLFATVTNAETFICHVKSNGPNMGLISDTIAVNIDDVTSDVVVSDSIILTTNNKPIAATLTTYTPKRLTIKWAVQGVKDTKNRVYNRVNYKLAIWKSRGNEVSVVANSQLNDGANTTVSKEVSGSGKCELR